MSGVDRNKRTLTVRGTGPEGVLLAGDRAAVYEVGEVLAHQDVVVLTVGEFNQLSNFGRLGELITKQRLDEAEQASLETDWNAMADSEREAEDEVNGESGHVFASSGVPCLDGHPCPTDQYVGGGCVAGLDSNAGARCPHAPDNSDLPF